MKKNLLLTLITLLALTACDAPRTSRALSSKSTSGLTNSNNAVPVNLDNGSSTNTTNPGTNTNPTTPSQSVIPSDATQCKFAADGVNGFESNSSHLGDYTLCQSSTDKNTVYFQLKTPPTNANGDVSICFIPTTNSGNNSIYVGNPMCGYFKDPKAIRKITFIKYPSYSSATITGAIFFKDLSWYYGYPFNQYVMTLDAYKTCMSMLNYPYYNSSYCTAFKNVGQYIYKQF